MSDHIMIGPDMFRAIPKNPDGSLDFTETFRETPKQGVGDINSNKKGSGARYNTGKPAMELIPISIIAETERQQIEALLNSNEDVPMGKVEAVVLLVALGKWQCRTKTIFDVLRAFQSSPWEDCAKVFDYGKRKYAEWNWAKGMNWSVPVGCIVRHALAILDGEENDPESGLPHRGHIACNLVMLAQYEKTFPEGNDIPFDILSGNIDNT